VVLLSEVTYNFYPKKYNASFYTDRSPIFLVSLLTWQLPLISTKVLTLLNDYTLFVFYRIYTDFSSTFFAVGVVVRVENICAFTFGQKARSSQGEVSYLSVRCLVSSCSDYCYYYRSYNWYMNSFSATISEH